MKKFIALILAVGLLSGLVGMHLRLFERFKSFEIEAKLSSGAMFVNKDGTRRFICSGTEIGKTTDGGGIFLTARHCVADVDTNEIRSNISVSFSSNEGGPFYDAKPIAISLTDDIALLYLRDGADIPAVDIKDERRLNSGDPVFNASFPLGAGKLVFHGEYMAPRFSYPPRDVPSIWHSSMPMNLTIAHGSSGSGVFSPKQRALIGIAVGTFEEGSYNIAIPADRVLDFLNDLKDNTVAKFEYAYPPHPDVLEGLF